MFLNIILHFFFCVLIVSGPLRSANCADEVFEEKEKMAGVSKLKPRIPLTSKRLYSPLVIVLALTRGAFDKVAIGFSKKPVFRFAGNHIRSKNETM